jgi:hypothetical protein
MCIDNVVVGPATELTFNVRLYRTRQLIDGRCKSLKRWAKGPISIGMASEYPSASPKPLRPEKREQLRSIIESFRLRVIGN